VSTFDNITSIQSTTTMSDEDYSGEEEYEYEYSDAESAGGGGADDVSMDARSQGGEEDACDDADGVASMTDNNKKKASSKNNGNSNNNKRRSTGSFDSRRRSGDNPNAAPMGGGKFDFDGEFRSSSPALHG